MRLKTTLCQMIIVFGLASQAFSKYIDYPTYVISQADFREHCDRLRLDPEASQVANVIHTRYLTDSYHAKRAVEQLNEWFESIDPRKFGGTNTALFEVKGYSYFHVKATWQQSVGDLDDAYFGDLRKAYPHQSKIIDELSRQRLRRRLLKPGITPLYHSEALRYSEFDLVQAVENHLARHEFTPEILSVIHDYEVGVHELLKKLDDTMATHASDTYRARRAFFREITESEIPRVLNACIEAYSKPHELSKKLRRRNLVAARRIIEMLPASDRQAIEDEIHMGLYKYMYRSDTHAVLARFKEYFANSEITPEQHRAGLDLWESYRHERTRYTLKLEPLYDEITSHEAYRDIQYAWLTEMRAFVHKQPLPAADRKTVDRTAQMKYTTTMEAWSGVIARYQQLIDALMPQ
ncbi:MAG: hypothetical protein IID30_09975 [Planctomycetes bacterium]|nr:hypothetical protein [Planctomycetota bacterium]